MANKEEIRKLLQRNSNLKKVAEKYVKERGWVDFYDLRHMQYGGVSFDEVYGWLEARENEYLEVR